MTSTEPKSWLVTGAGRGMGVDFARAALAAGHNVVVTGSPTTTLTSPPDEVHDRMQITDPRRPLCVEQ
jgi:NAD(P)-dependent dehydrogenase (short-subunit alcohol dehydrogenase family)